jgi:hypothetical protein
LLCGLLETGSKNNHKTTGTSTTDSSVLSTTPVQWGHVLGARASKAARKKIKYDENSCRSKA